MVDADAWRRGMGRDMINIGRPVDRAQKGASRPRRVAAVAAQRYFGWRGWETQRAPSDLANTQTLRLPDRIVQTIGCSEHLEVLWSPALYRVPI